MAIAPVLKTGVRKDLQVRILYPPFRAASCARTTKEKSYRATMRAELRNLVTAQEAFLIDAGWVIVMSVIALWMAVRRVETWETPQAA